MRCSSIFYVPKVEGPNDASFLRIRQWHTTVDRSRYLISPANTVKGKYMTFPATVDTDILDEIIRRIVAVAEPERIILFGSAARGDMRRDSDFDLLVIKSGDYDYGRLLGAIYRALIGVDYGVDVVLVTPNDTKRYRESPALIIASAFRDGREVYYAPALSSR